jgi:hypothetical protein
MASQPSYFFSDDYHSCLATDTKNEDITSLADIFSQIGSNITSARLIPNSAT